MKTILATALCAVAISAASRFACLCVARGNQERLAETQRQLDIARRDPYGCIASTAAEGGISNISLLVLGKKGETVFVGAASSNRIVFYPAGIFTNAGEARELEKQTHPGYQL